MVAGCAVRDPDRVTPPSPASSRQRLSADLGHAAAGGICRRARARIDGPPPPTAPAIVNRDAGGRATMRAIRISSPLTIDGRLDEEIYAHVSGAGEFVQQLPRANEPATEATRLWVFYDDRNLYVAVQCDDSAPQLETATEMRRDANNIFNNDNITITLDTFYDHRNGFSSKPRRSARFAISRSSTTRPIRAGTPCGTSGPLRRRLDRRNGDPVQVAALPCRAEPGLGHQLRRVDPSGRTSGVSDAGAAVSAPARALQMSSARHAGRPRVAAAAKNSSSNRTRVSRSRPIAATPPCPNDLAANGGVDCKYGLTRT